MLIQSKSSVLFLLLLLLPFSTHAQDIQWGSDITVRPPSPKAGEVVIFQLTVKAGKRAAKDFTVVGGIDGKRIFSKEVGVLKPQASRHLRFKWRATGGAHKVFFQIVARDHSRAALPARLSKAISIQGIEPVQATRSVEKDTWDAQAVSTPVQSTSQARKPVKSSLPTQMSTTMPLDGVAQVGMKQPICEGTPLPDIEMLPSIGMKGSAILDSAGGLEVVLPFSISVVVVNRGQCDSGVFSINAKMRVQGSGVDEVVQLGNKGAPSLKPCRTSDCSDAKHGVRFDYTPQYNHAYYYFTVEADATHSINEFNEENNVTNQEMRIDQY